MLLRAVSTEWQELSQGCPLGVLSHLLKLWHDLLWAAAGREQCELGSDETACDVSMLEHAGSK